MWEEKALFRTRRGVHAQRASISLREKIILHDDPGSATRQHPAPDHKRHAIGNHRRQVQIVHHSDYPAATARIILKKAHHQKLVTDVEACDRFVQQQPAGDPVHLRLPDLTQHPRELRALLFSP